MVTSSNKFNKITIAIITLVLKDFTDLDHVKDLEFEKIAEEEKCC